MSLSPTARWRVLGPGDEVDLSIEITHGGLERIDPILELTESAIAVEAQQPANLARCVVVVDLGRCSGATNGAHKPPCAAIIASASAAVIPYRRLR